MKNRSLNELLYEKLEEQVQGLYETIATPVFQHYSALLRSYQEGTATILNEVEGMEAFLIERSTDISAPNPYFAFVEQNRVNERVGIDGLKQQLQECFAEPEAKIQFGRSGAVLFSYDWYFNYDSAMNFFRKGLTYPIIAEPRFLNQELPPGHYDGFAKGPDFSHVWPDCSVLAEGGEHELLVHLRKILMKYYQYQSRLFLHTAIREMDENDELNLIKDRPFLFYISEHDCEDMTLYVA